ncbi:MAG TPA: metallopeptidase family protein [Phycisphaerae bacterium]|nr:metallopeptidase family protein [Phycisphaerae bacterium]
MDRDRFEELVDEAVDRLPPEFAARLDNVDVVVAARPSRRTLREMGLLGRGTLLGLYRGVPQTRRTTQYSGVAPDQIVIYRDPVLAEADASCPPEADDEEFEQTIREVVRKTVLHEIGHHFGLSEADLRRIDFG